MTITRSKLVYHFMMIGLSTFCCSGLYSAQTAAQPFLWKISNQFATVYLAGSIHALNDQYYPLASAMQNAFDTSDKLVLELNLDKINPAKVQALVEYKTWLPNGRSLEEYLSTEDLVKLQKYSHEMDIPYLTLIKMRPWVVIESLTNYQLKQSDFKADKGVDRYFLNLANKREMPILELESLEQQISALADAPFESQMAALSLSLQQMEDDSYLNTMANYWRQGKDQALYDFVYQDIKDNPDIQPMMEKLLDERNENMADVIGIYLVTHQTYFVVVGALHLSGPNSVVNILKNKGYQVEKVTQ